MDPDQWLYLFTLAVARAASCWRATCCAGASAARSIAIRDHATAAEAMGIDVALFKTRAFAVSAMLTGVAGSLGAIAVQFVAPDSFTVFLSDHPVRRRRGRRSRLGGGGGGRAARSSSSCPMLAETVSKAAPGAVYGAILIAVLLLMPSGAAGAMRSAGPPRGGPRNARFCLSETRSTEERRGNVEKIGFGTAIAFLAAALWAAPSVSRRTAPGVTEDGDQDRQHHAL